MAAQIETASWRWVSGTPLGLPVVPEVYASSAVSCGRATIPAVGLVGPGSSRTSTVISGADRRSPAPSPASRRAGSGSAKASTAPESATRCLSSAAV